MRKSLKILLVIIVLGLIAFAGFSYLTIPVKEEALNPEFNKIFVLPNVAPEDNIYNTLIELEKIAPDVSAITINNDKLSLLSDAEIEAVLEKNQEALEQYMAVYNKKRFVDISIETSVRKLPEWDKLVRLSIIQKARRGDYSSAIDLWANNMEFYQRIMSDYPSAFTVAIVMVAYNLNRELLPKIFSTENLSTLDKDRIRKTLEFKFYDQKNGWNAFNTLVVEYYSMLKGTFPRDENLNYTNAEPFKKALIQFAYEGDETTFNLLLRNRRIVYLVNNTKNQFVKFASDFDHLYTVAPENLEDEAKDIELKCFIENLRKEVLLVGEAVGCSIAAFGPLVNSAAKIDIDSQEILCEMGLKECAQKK